MDHPQITKAIQTGYPHGEPTYPHCPVCGCECETVFMDENNVVFGCEECTKKKSAWECEECL